MFAFYPDHTTRLTYKKNFTVLVVNDNKRARLRKVSRIVLIIFSISSRFFILNLRLVFGLRNHFPLYLYEFVARYLKHKINKSITTHSNISKAEKQTFFIWHYISLVAAKVIA